MIEDFVREIGGNGFMRCWKIEDDGTYFIRGRYHSFSLYGGGKGQLELQ
jgi:hypothetical protein